MQWLGVDVMTQLDQSHFRKLNRRLTKLGQLEEILRQIYFKYDTSHPEYIDELIRESRSIVYDLGVDHTIELDHVKGRLQRNETV